MPFGRSLVSAALAIVLAGCGGSSGPLPAGDTVHRWVASDPSSVVAPEDLHRVKEAFRWTFENPAQVEPWEIEDLGDPAHADGGVVLSIAGDEPQLTRLVELDARELDAIEVEMVGLRGGKITLQWAAPGDPLTPRNSMTVTDDRGQSGLVKSHVFNLRSHPGWHGSIGRLRLRPDPRGDGDFRLVAVTGTRWASDPVRLENALRQPWKVDLDSEVRNALLAPPSSTIDSSLTIPPGAVLSFGIGLEEHVDEAVKFVVSVSLGGGDDVVVFSRTIHPRQAGRWIDAAVSLDRFAGSDARIRLSTSTRRPLDVAHGLPLWANPEVTVDRNETGPNILLICLDTLRADRLSSYGHWLPTSPNIDGWARDRAVLFRNTVANAPWTLPSHATMFTGLEAMRHGVNHYGAVPSSFEMVAETLRGAGYTTAAITGGGYLRPQFGFAQGFDSFAYWPRENSEAELSVGIDAAEKWLDANHRRPFFLFFHTYEVHYPHRPRQPYFNRFAQLAGVEPIRPRIQMRPSDWTDLRVPGDFFVIKRPGGRGFVRPLHDDEKALINLMYDSAVAFTDHKLRRLFERLERHGILDRTIVIVTSDHGEALGEDDRAGHSFLRDYNLMVPLIVGLPGGEGAGTVVDRQVSLTDLTPTILDAAGVAGPSSMDGVSLVPLIRGDSLEIPSEAWSYSASNNRGIALRLDNRVKYILTNAAWSLISGEDELFDLEADPQELVDVSATDPRRPELRNRVIDGVLQQHEGYRLTIRNRGAQQLRGWLGGSLANHARLKTADPDCDCIHWKPGARPRIRLEPGQQVRLHLESPSQPHMTLALWTFGNDGGRQRQTWRFEPGDLTDPVVWSLTGKGWRQVEDPAAVPEIGFKLWHEGDRIPGDSSEPAADEEMLDQLRALGYVQ